MTFVAKQYWQEEQRKRFEADVAAWKERSRRQRSKRDRALAVNGLVLILYLLVFSVSIGHGIDFYQTRIGSVPTARTTRFRRAMSAPTGMSDP